MPDAPDHRFSCLTKRVRRLLPYALIAMSLWFMAGCFYLPLPEHPSDKSQTGNKKEKDFRGLIGPVGSKHPIQPGVTRAQVVALLGPTGYKMTNDQLLYSLLTDRAAWVAPLCFSAVPATERGYALRLTFDKNDVLLRWELAHSDEQLDWFINAPGGAEFKAVDVLQKKGPSSSASLPTTQP
jgi:hypothetical protein